MLGPRVLELARTRAAGALPYLVTPEHARSARVGPYLRLSNYAANLRRIGFDSEDLAFPGSDRLVDALALQGDPETPTVGLRAHLEAGANQVAIQVLSADDAGDILPTARALSGPLAELSNAP